jgi:GDPmannose 4,6-dehydratase
MHRAFITGITGQDGSYLAELLLEKGYEVHGLVHRPEGLSSGNLGRLVADEAINNKRLFLHTGSFEDTTHLRRLIMRAKPSEFYHLAAQSSPRLSLELPETTMESVGMATVRLLEILRDLDNPPKFLYASSSEIFGEPANTPQNEMTPMSPSTPYGVAKALSTQMAKIYRAAYGLNTCAAILYNHESPRRSGQFVTMKIARAAARIRLGWQKKLQLGNLAGQRDWGWAPDYIRGLWMMLQQEKVDEFVLATGQLHSVQQFVERAFAVLGLSWQDHVEHDAGLMTAVEPARLCGDPSKAKRVLGWENTVPFDALVERLVISQLETAKDSRTPYK